MTANTTPNKTELPEQIKYFIREMRNPSLNEGTRVQYRNIIFDISQTLQRELVDFDRESVFIKKK